jgi:hypothetical protein
MRVTAAASQKADEPELAKAPLRPVIAAHPGPTDTSSLKASTHSERRREEWRATASQPSPFAPTARGGLSRQRPASPQPTLKEDKLPKVVSFGGGALLDEAHNEEPLPPQNLDTLALDGDDDGELPSFFRNREEEFSYRPARRSLFIAGILAAVVIAVGLAHILTRTEGSAASGQGADKISLVRPSDDGVVAAVASGDENKPISRLITSGGTGDSPIEVGEARALADHPATDDGTGRDNSGLPKMARTLVLSPDMPAVGGKAAPEHGADELPRSVNPAAVPSAMPAPESAAANASSVNAIGETQLDTAVDHDKVSAIPVNPDPSAIGGGEMPAMDASAGAASAATGSLQAGSMPSSAAGAAAPLSDSGAAVANDDLGARAPPAKAPTPPAKPADKPVIFASRGGPIGPAPNKVAKQVTSPLAGAFSSGVFVQLSAQKSQGAAKSTYHSLQTKFPTILGKLDPNIQRVDLGGKGVVYRVRVGPFAFADAQKICGSYKAVGGSDCLIVRH